MSLKKRFLRTAAGFLGAAIAATGLPSAVRYGGAPIAAEAAGGAPNYAEALALSLYFFDANACGGNIEGGPLTWRGNCHTYDGQADLADAEGLSSSEKDAIKAANGGSSIIDASGGYHDAGDHIKFSMTIGFAITSVAWSYFSYPEAFKTADCEGHVKYILRNACDYFMKTTFLDDSGSVIAYVDQVASEGEDHSVWTSPEAQTMKRTVFWASPSTPIADSAGQMSAALASSSLAFKDSDPDYAAECRKYAKALADFADKYPTYNAKGRGGMYSGDGSLKDDIVWAKLWCDVAEFGKKLPADYTPPATLTGNAAYSTGEYDGWLYCWNKVYSGYAALLAELGYDGDKYKNECAFEVKNAGGEKFSTSSYAANWGWGSARYNCAVQGIAWRSDDAQLQAAAKHQMDCILDSSTAFKSYFVGYGNSYPLHYHHRASNPGTTGSAEANTAAKYILYGALLGGPDDTGGYKDEQNAYTCTEPALDYNGCFVLACAPLVAEYGGDSSAMKELAKTAPEINADFDFGEASAIVTTTAEPTTEPATTTEPAPDQEYVKIKNGVVERFGDGQLYISGDTPVRLTYSDDTVFYSYLPEFFEGDTVTGGVTYVPEILDGGDGKTVYGAALDVFLQPDLTWGDADLDGKVMMNDVVLIMQSLSNADRFGLEGSEDTHITKRGQRNSDVSDSRDGVTAKDALVVQEYLLKLRTELIPGWSLAKG